MTLRVRRGAPDAMFGGRVTKPSSRTAHAEPRSGEFPGWGKGPTKWERGEGQPLRFLWCEGFVNAQILMAQAARIRGLRALKSAQHPHASPGRPWALVRTLTRQCPATERTWLSPLAHRKAGGWPRVIGWPTQAGQARRQAAGRPGDAGKTLTRSATHPLASGSRPRCSVRSSPPAQSSWPTGRWPPVPQARS